MQNWCLHMLEHHHQLQPIRLWLSSAPTFACTVSCKLPVANASNNSGSLFRHALLAVSAGIVSECACHVEAVGTCESVV